MSYGRSREDYNNFWKHGKEERDKSKGVDSDKMGVEWGIGMYIQDGGQMGRDGNVVCHKIPFLCVYPNDSRQGARSARMNLTT